MTASSKFHSNPTKKANGERSTIIFLLKVLKYNDPEPFNSNATSRNLYRRRYENAWVSVTVLGFSPIIQFLETIFTYFIRV